MTNADLRDQAVAALQQTTVGYRNRSWKTPPAGTYWASALAALSLISDPPPTATNPVPPPAAGAYFGAYIEGTQTLGHYYPAEAPWGNAPWDGRTWDRFERDAGKKVALLMFGQPNWMSAPFPRTGLDAVHARGAIPVLDVMTDTIPLTDITAGKYDALITAWATAAAGLGYAFVLRWNCEANGTWYGYGAQARANPAHYLDAWRRTHDLFTAAGATNVSWHWCPNVDPEATQTPLEQLYPGDDYCDWVGMTGYVEAAGETFGWVFLDTYSRLLKLAPDKPVMIGETASYGPFRAQFLTELFATLPTMPAVKALCWFNWRLTENGVVKDWPIQAASLPAFKAGISAARYVGRP